GPAFVAVPPQTINGLPYVTLHKDDVYEVVLYNESQYEAAVSLNIDGMSMFVFSSGLDPKAGPDSYPRLIIDPGKPFEAKGWHISNERIDEFLVTKKAESVGAKFRQRGGVGTITACFSAAWPKDEPRTRSGDAGTGRGGQLDAQFVTVRRDFGAPRAT